MLYKKLKYLAENKFELAGSVIRFLIPFLKDRMNLINAYDVLSVFPSKENTAFLKTACLNNRNKKDINIILRGFSNSKDQDVFDFLVDIYNNESALNSNGKQSIIKILSQSKNETTERILVTELLGTDIYVSGHACECLKSLDYSEKDIVTFLNSVFYDPTKSEHLESLLIVYQNIQNPTLLPPVDIVYKALETVLNRKGSAVVSYSAAHIFIKLYDDSVPDLLYKLLEHENGAIRKNSLVIINRLYFTKDHLIDFNMTDKMIEKMIELIKRNDRGVEGWAMQVLTEIYLKTKNDKILDALCSCLEKGNEQVLNSLMYYLNKIFKTVGFQESALAGYFKILDHKNKELRKAAVEGLQYSGLQAVKDRFLILAKDNDPEISRLAKSIRRLPRNFVKYPEYTRTELMERAKERTAFLAFNKLRN